MNFEHSLRQ